MNLTISTSCVSQPLQALWRWLVTQPRPDTRIQPSTCAVHPSHTRGAFQPRPLRVWQLIETGQSSGHGSRLRISGRMADVCAELDRLAAREALQH